MTKKDFESTVVDYHISYFISEVLPEPTPSEHADGQRCVARLDNVRKGFDIRCGVESIFIGPLIIKDVDFGVVGHGKSLFESRSKRRSRRFNIPAK